MLRFIPKIQKGVAPALSKRTFASGVDLARHYPKTEVTTLPNGLRVATEHQPGQTATVGVWIDSGSRFEDEKNNGVAHFLEHLFFKGTNRRSRTQLEEEIENMGGHLNAYTSRAHTAFYTKVMKGDVNNAVDILADILRNSKFENDAIERERHTILREAEEIDTQLEEVVFDKLHETAYRGTPLGRTILGTQDNILNISRDDIVDYVETHYTAPRMVIAAAGEVDHKTLVNLASKYFGDVPSAPRSGKKVFLEPAKFTGSDLLVRHDDMEKAHIAFAYPTAGWNDPDTVNLMVMQAMLGAYDREASNLQGKHHASHFVSQNAKLDIALQLMPFMTQYSDTGLFGFYAVSRPVGQYELISNCITHLTRMAVETDEDRLLDAKAQLTTTILSTLDGTTQTVEEIGRQLLAHGRRVHPTELIARIDAVDVHAICQTAERYFWDRDHACAAIGPIYELPDYNLRRRKSFWHRI